jgi:hypothetical protein
MRRFFSTPMRAAAKDGHCGAIAFSRIGDPALGNLDGAVILKTVG